MTKKCIQRTEIKQKKKEIKQNIVNQLYFNLSFQMPLVNEACLPMQRATELAG